MPYPMPLSKPALQETTRAFLFWGMRTKVGQPEALQISILDELGRGDVESSGNLQNVQQGEVPLTSLYFSHVTAIDFSQVGKRLLGEMDLFPTGTNGLSECEQIPVDIDFG